MNVEKAFRDMAVREELSNLRSVAAEAEEPKSWEEVPDAEGIQGNRQGASKDITY